MGKYFFKRAISLLLIYAVWISPLAPNIYATDQQGESSDEQLYTNNITTTSDIDILIEDLNANQEALEYINTNEIESEDCSGSIPYPLAISGTRLSSARALPSRFSSRDKGWTSPVKHQESHNYCIMFACLSALETYLLKNNLGSYDFSERHMSWAMTPDSTGYGWQRVINDYNAKYEGSFGFAAAGFLASNLGPKLESDIPFISTLDDYKPSNMNTAPTQIDVTDIMYVDVSDMDTIKAAVSEYGAISTSYVSYSQYYSDSKEAYYMPDPTTQLNLHEINVVGWDDNYSKENFGQYKPTKNGAWLVKNSWGENFGDSGYCWISYEDAMLFKCNTTCPAYAIIGARKQGNIKLYQHDEFGATNVFKVKTNSSDVPVFYNVYNFTADYDTLDSVRFFTSSIGAKYNIYYAPVNSEGIPTTNKSDMTKLASGVVEHSGYMSVPTNDYKIPLGLGSIALELQTADNVPVIGVDSDYSPSSFGGFRSKIGEKTCFVSTGSKIDEFKNVAHRVAEVSLKAVAKGNTNSSPNGWIVNSDGSWSYKVNNVLIKGWTKDISGWNGQWFYFDTNGIMKTSWFKVGETWYYSASNGVMKTGWVNQAGGWYFMGSDGAMQTDWIFSDNKWYYLDLSGVMKSGWVFNRGAWYYLNPAFGGAMSCNEWLLEGGNWYRLSSNGSAETGIVRINNKNHLFAQNGVWLGELT